jgi:uncharacterized protein YebE (UPF0316 family)
MKTYIDPSVAIVALLVMALAFALGMIVGMSIESNTIFEQGRSIGLTTNLPNNVTLTFGKYWIDGTNYVLFETK